MPFKIMKAIADRIARRAGYVPETQLHAVVRDKADTEKELRHTVKNLEHQIEMRSRLDQEIAFLRLLQLKQANGDSATEKSISRLEAVTEMLTNLMQDTWPAAVLLEAPTVPDDPVPKVA